MRIISGKFKGRTIKMPKGIRPTSDKVREALFDILKACIQGAAFLDLYCGSGAVGIEAFSRGSAAVSLVDNNPVCITAVKENLKRLGIADSPDIKLYKIDALRSLEKFRASSTVFDIIFLDPPYYKEMARNTLIAISDCDILSRNVVVAAEVFKKDTLPDMAGCLKKTHIARYGDTQLEFFKRSQTG